MVEIKNILFPYDLTEHGPTIVPYVLSFAEKYNCAVTIFHVIDDNYRWGEIYLALSNQGIQNQVLVAAEKAVDDFCEDYFKKVRNINKKIIFGNPSTEILKEIDAEGIDHVIMGTHGRKGLQHAIFGSTAENVVKKSPVPVTIINPHRLRNK